MAEFKIDGNGNVILKQMIGWEMRHIVGTLLVVGVEYADSRNELEKGLSRTLPLVLEPSMALDLAEALKTQAGMLFETTPAPTSIQ
jgi:hypothetical protein